jgi:hypothetical protein
MQAEDDRIRAAIEQRLKAVEALIPLRPPWRVADEPDRGSRRVRVVAGPAVTRGSREPSPFGLSLVGLTVLIVAAALSLVGGLGSPQPAPGWANRFPIQTAERFSRPFTYAIDPASGIEPDAGSVVLQQFLVRDPANPERSNRIVAVRLADLVNVEPCRSGGSTMPVTSAQDFVDYIGAIRGLAVSAPVAAVVDGRPALQFDVTNRLVTTCPAVSIWPSEGPFSETAAARRILAFDVDGTTILVVAAVAQASDLGGWLATADQLIATIHFSAPGRSPSPRP